MRTRQQDKERVDEDKGGGMQGSCIDAQNQNRRKIREQAQQEAKQGLTWNSRASEENQELQTVQSEKSYSKQQL